MPRYLAARFLPADVTKLRVEDLPVLPAWFPLPPKGDNGERLAPVSPEERAQARTDRAIAEACEGPHDGRREQVMLNHDGTPPERVLLYDNSIVYTLDQGLSTDKMLTYRYTPQLSHAHPGLMAAITEGFHEYGADYAQEASTDDATADRYQER
jgi:hypothetical protein